MTHKRVLIVVDDEPHTPRMLKMKLETEGWDVRIARNGAEALELLKAGPTPDALITDIQMPVMDGKALCQAIAMQFPDRQFPLFVATSLVERDIREWTSKISNLGFIEKPVSPRKFTLALEHSLNSSSSDSS